MLHLSFSFYSNLHLYTTSVIKKTSVHFLLNFDKNPQRTAGEYPEDAVLCRLQSGPLLRGRGAELRALCLISLPFQRSNSEESIVGRLNQLMRTKTIRMVNRPRPDEGCLFVHSKL